MEKFPWNGIPSVSEGDGLAGIGTKRKRMPLGNRADRGFYNERIIYRRDTRVERLLTSKVVETEKAP